MLVRTVLLLRGSLFLLKYIHLCHRRGGGLLDGHIYRVFCAFRSFCAGSQLSTFIADNAIELVVLDDMTKALLDHLPSLL